MIIWRVRERVRLRHTSLGEQPALVAHRGWAWLSGILAYGRPAMGVAGLL